MCGHWIPTARVVSSGQWIAVRIKGRLIESLGYDGPSFTSYSSSFFSYICKTHPWHTFSAFQRRAQGDGELYHARLFYFRTQLCLQRLQEPQSFKVRTSAKISIFICVFMSNLFLCKHFLMVNVDKKKKNHTRTPARPFKLSSYSGILYHFPVLTT